MGRARYTRSPKEERTFNGKVYDSKKEAAHAAKLHALAAAGAISDLQEQVPFVICPKVKGLKGSRDLKYVADFVYVAAGRKRVIDVKGHKTQLYCLKKRLVEWLHEVVIEEI